jgi:hypothetical protein
MELILLQKVRNLGTLGDKVVVKPGYGRNFLLPQGKAVRVNAANLAAFEQRRPMPRPVRPSWPMRPSPSRRTPAPKASCSVRSVRVTSPRRSRLRVTPSTRTK